MQPSRRQVPLVVAMALLMVLTIATPSYAYSLEEARWNNQPAPGTCCAHINVGIESGDAAVSNAWANGISAWNSSPAYIYYDRPSSYKVGLAEINDGSTSADGYTSYYYSFGYFYSMSAWLNFAWISNYDAAKANGVGAHELGHVAGLGHTGGCVLMQTMTETRSSCGITGPVADDRDGINALY